jgi:hypothetical protein
MIEFMRGIRAPVSTILIPASVRIRSNKAGYVASRSRTRYLTVRIGLIQVHDEIPRGLGEPGRGGMCGGGEGRDAAGGVFNGGEDVLALPPQGDGLDEVEGQKCVGLAAQEVGPARG